MDGHTLARTRGGGGAALTVAPWGWGQPAAPIGHAFRDVRYSMNGRPRPSWEGSRGSPALTPRGTQGTWGGGGSHRESPALTPRRTQGICSPAWGTGGVWEWGLPCADPRAAVPQTSGVSAFHLHPWEPPELCHLGPRDLTGTRCCPKDIARLAAHNLLWYVIDIISTFKLKNLPLISTFLLLVYLPVADV